MNRDTAIHFSEKRGTIGRRGKITNHPAKGYLRLDFRMNRTCFCPLWGLISVTRETLNGRLLRGTGMRLQIIAAGRIRKSKAYMHSYIQTITNKTQQQCIQLQNGRQCKLTPLGSISPWFLLSIILPTRIESATIKSKSIESSFSKTTEKQCEDSRIVYTRS